MAGNKTDYVTLELLKDALGQLGVQYPTPPGGGLSAPVARSDLAGGTPLRLVYNVVTTGLLGEVDALTPDRILKSDANGIPVATALTEAGLSGSGPSVQTFASPVTVADVLLPASFEQSLISIRFRPLTDDVELYAIVSQDGVAFENSAGQYDFVGLIENGTGTVTGYTSASAAQLILQEDNGNASAGVGSQTFEGVWGAVRVENRGVASLEWPTLSWDLSYRNAVTQARKVHGQGSRMNGERITAVRFFFEGNAQFTGSLGVLPVG